MNMSYLIDLFCNYLRTMRYSPRTISSYRYDLNHFKDFWDTIPAEERTAEKFKMNCFSYVDSLFQSKSNEEYASTSINRKRASLRKFIHFLSTREHIPQDFSKQIEFISVKNKQEKEILTSDEIQSLEMILTKRMDEGASPYQQFIHLRNQTAFTLFLFTGMRVSELVQLQWSHISFEHAELRVLHGKGGKQRTVPIPPPAHEKLLHYKQQLLEIGQLSDDNSYLFRKHNGTSHISARTMERLMEGLIAEAKIEKHITPHSLRHTMASFAIKNQMSIPVLSSILGHNKSSITLDIYSHVISEQQRKDEMAKLTF